MSKYVDLDKVIDKIEDEWGYEGIREDLYDIPTADVEKVIRCKDCKYCDKEDEHEYWCTGRGFPCQSTTLNDYCSKGRKKGDVEEVVRCFKCKYSHISEKDMILRCRLNGDRSTDPYGYCDRGKEKEE